jgi:hypothetical protein
MENISYSDGVKYEDVLQSRRRRTSSIKQKKGRLTGLVTPCAGTAF